MRVKLLLSYDITKQSQDRYYQFVMSEFFPKMQELGLKLTEVWSTAYGQHPLRMTCFVAEDEGTLRQVLDSHVWDDQEYKLRRYVTGLKRRVVPYKEWFQY